MEGQFSFPAACLPPQCAPFFPPLSPSSLFFIFFRCPLTLPLFFPCYSFLLYGLILPLLSPCSSALLTLLPPLSFPWFVVSFFFTTLILCASFLLLFLILASLYLFSLHTLLTSSLLYTTHWYRSYPLSVTPPLSHSLSHKSHKPDFPDGTIFAHLPASSSIPQEKGKGRKEREKKRKRLLIVRNVPAASVTRHSDRLPCTRSRRKPPR